MLNLLHTLDALYLLKYKTNLDNNIYPYYTLREYFFQHLNLEDYT